VRHCTLYNIIFLYTPISITCQRVVLEMQQIRGIAAVEALCCALVQRGFRQRASAVVLKSTVAAAQHAQNCRHTAYTSQRQ
jgi:hypothetical protein